MVIKVISGSGLITKRDLKDKQTTNNIIEVPECGVELTVYYDGDDVTIGVLPVGTTPTNLGT